MVSAVCSRIVGVGERRLLLSFGFFAVPVVTLVLLAAPSFAGAEVAPAPAWQVTTAAIPTVLPPGIGRHGTIYIAIENIGGASSSGEVNVKDVLPAGLTVTNVAGCSQITSSEVGCSFSEPVVPSGFITITVGFEVTGAVGSLANIASVSGGGAPPATGEVTMQVGKTAGETGPGGDRKGWV